MRYDYKCGNCGYEFELVISMLNKPLDIGVACPKCLYMGVKMQRKLNKIPILFKGSGFYVNDSKRQNKGK